MSIYVVVTMIIESVFCPVRILIFTMKLIHVRSLTNEIYIPYDTFMQFKTYVKNGYWDLSNAFYTMAWLHKTIS